MMLPSLLDFGFSFVISAFFDHWNFVFNMLDFCDLTTWQV